MAERQTICYWCLDLFPAYAAINAGKLELVPAGQWCPFCCYLEEHRAPCKSEISSSAGLAHMISSRKEV